MLVALSIRDIVLIEKLDLGFSKGLTVFTGETGAGKSIILDSLSLALGARGDGGLVRKGASSASVTASFEIEASNAAFEKLRDHGLDDGEGLILRRVQYSDGRTKAFVNDRPVSTSLLREIGQTLVELHGQHDDRALLDASAHREILDRFGGLLPDVGRVSALWDDWREKRSIAERLQQELDLARRDEAYLAASCRELDDLAPKEGEEEALAEKRKVLMASAKTRADLEAAADALSPQSFPSGKLSALLRRMERQPALPPELRSILEAIERVLIEADEARTLVEKQLRAQSEDNVEAIEERLFKLRAVARKHRVSVDGLPGLHRRFLEDLDRLEMGTERLQGARKDAEAAGLAYAQAAASLSQKRKTAAERLERAIAKELKPLKLEKARFLTHTQLLNGHENDIGGGPLGRETVMFFVQTNPGAKPGPLTKVASGGELARFLLALKVVAADKNSAPVLIFDEIDTGVGGATATAIGERLSRLGQKAQVLAVTHSPQVAAHADTHYKLYKTSRGTDENITVETSAEALDAAGRREEIARMLAGRKVTQEARAAADSLIGGRHDIAG
jgi:DNA repair protein RecN (Recombination protein N)